MTTLTTVELRRWLAQLEITEYALPTVKTVLYVEQPSRLGGLWKVAKIGRGQFQVETLR